MKRTLLLLGATLTGVVTAGAQTPAPDTSSRELTPPGGIAAGPLLDAPIDRREYRLGAGDVLDVAILGDLSRVYSVQVTPEGTALIPSIGVARVLGLSLEQAEARVRDLVFRYYRNVEVRVTLSRVRSFKVFVLGDVASPGVRAANAATRVSEVVPLAASNGVRRRNVIIRRASGDTITSDLVRFLQTGDLGANPTLREGDALVVPVIDRTVEVFGRVNFPGTYEFRPGESLAQLLSIVNGGGNFPANAADTIRMARFIGRERREVRLLSRGEALGAEGAALLIQPFDAIYVSAVANFMLQKSAIAQGQVKRPGAYPIRPDTTTIRDLVEMAGGFTPEASLVDATLRRLPEGVEGASLRQLQNVPPELLSTDEQRILSTRSQSDPTVVVLDFQQLFLGGNDALNQTLRSGDVLDVPVRRTGVAVLGAVTQPGIIQHIPGRSLNEYVDLAGGYSRRADRGDVTVLRGRLGTRTDAGDVRTVEPGDQIIVPFKQRRTLLQTLQNAQTVITTISGLVLTILALQNLL